MASSSPQAIPEGNAALAEVALSVACEPYDWAMTAARWRNGDVHWTDFLGLLPVVSATLFKHSDDLLGLAKAAENAGDVAQASRKIPLDLALGIQNNLDDFSDAVGGTPFQYWKQLNLYDNTAIRWPQAFEQALNSTEGAIHFNLNGLDIPNALAGDPTDWLGRYTAWELQAIIRNESWLSRTLFYLDGRMLTSDELIELGIELVE